MIKKSPVFNNSLNLNRQNTLELSRDINKILISKLIEDVNHPIWAELKSAPKTIGKLTPENQENLLKWEQKYMQKLENQKIEILFDAYKKMPTFNNIDSLTKKIRKYLNNDNFNFDPIIPTNYRSEIEDKIVTFYNFMANFIKEADLLACINEFTINNDSSVKVENEKIIVNFKSDWYSVANSKKMYDNGDISTYDPFAPFVNQFLEVILKYLLINSSNEKLQKIDLQKYAHFYYLFIIENIMDNYNLKTKNKFELNEYLLINFIFIPANNVRKAKGYLELMKEAFTYFYLTPSKERTICWEYLIYFFTKQIWYPFYNN